jgi:hypothetical protein
MTPELAYELIMNAYEDEAKALQAYTEIMLASMPDPK